LGNNLIGCEVGVFMGQFSDVIVNKISPKELHLIDLFEGINHSGDKDGNNIVYANLEEVYDNLKSKYDSNVYIHKGDSKLILNNFEDEYFDFIYIDGDHSYDGVKSDLIISYNKVKKGGYIMGHDYMIQRWEGVYSAVNDFCNQYTLKIDYLTNDKCPSFGIIKK
jgi:hypothetical protein